MPTQTDITIYQGATFTQDLTVTSTVGKSYTASIVDTSWCYLIVDLTTAIIDSTTVRISLTATQTDALDFPSRYRDHVRLGQIGHWSINEDDGSAITRTHQGRANLSRAGVQ